MTYADEIGQEAFQKLVADFFAHHYHDRGMVKWQGYYLSDHTAALNQQAAAKTHLQNQPLLSQQSTELIRQQLATAYRTGQSVNVQLQTSTIDCQLAAPLGGKVHGYTEDDEVVIGEATVPIAAIRHVTLVPFSPSYS